MSHRNRLAPAVAGLVISLLALPVPLAAADVDGPTTLQELVRSAVATHPTVGYADTNIQRAQADIKLVSSALLPKVELNAVYWRFQEEQTIELAPGETFVVRPLEDWVWSADVRQTLFYGLRAWRARDVAKLNRDIADLDRTTSINNLTLAVAAEFYTALAAEESVEVAQTALEANEGQLKLTQRLYEVGEATSADAARW